MTEAQFADLHAVLSAVAVGSIHSTRDGAAYCPHCDGFYDYGRRPVDFAHDATCIVLAARRLITELTPTGAPALTIDGERVCAR